MVDGIDLESGLKRLSFGRSRRPRPYSVALALASFTFLANPTISSRRMVIQVMSISHHWRPWRAEYWKAWWLLCQPSP